jgi:hypothetical protein
MVARNTLNVAKEDSRCQIDFNRRLATAATWPNSRSVGSKPDVRTDILEVGISLKAGWISNSAPAVNRRTTSPPQDQLVRSEAHVWVSSIGAMAWKLLSVYLRLPFDVPRGRVTQLELYRYLLKSTLIWLK